VLASASPRRRALLAQLGVQFCCEPADIDESCLRSESAADYVRRLAEAKATAIATQLPLGKYAVLGADTAVEIDGDILGKPRNYSDGLATLQRLSGRHHEVLSGICLQSDGELETCVVSTTVHFVELSRRVCSAYLATDEPWDKAGAYAIQGLGGAFVSTIHGSYSNVVGLPLAETWALLVGHGVMTALESSDE
jgi:septum formation protein